MLGYWWGVLGVIMVPQSDLPPKPLGATVPQSSLFRWKWAPKLKPLPLHSSKALDSYFWAQSFLGVDKLNHKKKSKISENRLNRLVNYIRLMVLKLIKVWLRTLLIKCNKYLITEQLSVANEWFEEQLNFLKMLGFKEVKRFLEVNFNVQKK